MGPGTQQLNVTSPSGPAVWDTGLPLQHGTQSVAPGVQPGQLIRKNPPPGAATCVQPVLLQQPAPQFAAPGVQPAVQPVWGLSLHAPVVSLQRQPSWLAVPPANAHPQPSEPATPQHPDSFADSEQLTPGVQELEHMGASSSGQFPIAQVLTDPPTLQSPPPWQQQQQPETAPAPELTPQELVEKSAHERFVGVCVAIAEGTAIE